MSAAAIRLSELEQTHRVDSESYQPHYLANVRFLKDNSAFDAKCLGDLLTSISGGATPLGANYLDEGIPFLRVQNIMQGYLDLDDLVYISPAVHADELRRSQLQPRDVLLTITGVSYGKAAYVPPNFGPANINQHSVRIALKPGLVPEYVAMFLNSHYGKLQTDQKTTGGTRPALDYQEIKRIVIPILPIENQLQVRKLLGAVEQKRSQAKALYASAQALLAAELRLDKLALPSNDIATRRTSEVVSVSRFDAEYFHPQKAYVQAWLSKLPGKAVADYYQSARQIYNPPKQDTSRAILNFDLTDALRYFVDETSNTTLEYEIGSIKKRLQFGDVVVSRLRSYLKEVAVVEVPRGVEAVGSSEFIVLRQLNTLLNPETLMVYLRSEPVQVILKWSQDGSNHPRFQEEELMTIRIPDRILPIQDEVRKMVRAGIEAHRDAQRLLAEAKAEVERMIEEA